MNMKLPLLIGTLFLCLSLPAQLIVQDSFLVEGTIDDTQLGPEFEIRNDGTNDVTFFWKLIVPDDVPRDWKFHVCDTMQQSRVMISTK